ncbi:hypothetical protein BKM15_18510 [Pseudomonas syringae pv. syringae]|nr:hypothetical protein BKM15_18510 [Pseudomonas syringae pv. syringae]
MANRLAAMVPDTRIAFLFTWTTVKDGSEGRKSLENGPKKQSEKNFLCLNKARRQSDDNCHIN